MNATKATAVSLQADKSPYAVAFERFKFRMNFWLRTERGRTSALAKELQVNRQTVWRWFNEPWSKFPGWAAVACNCYYHKHVPRETDAYWKELFKRGELVLPQKGQVSLSGLQRVVSPQADKFVRGSADNGH